MVRSFFIALVVVPLCSLSAHALHVSAVRDSVGIARKDGKLFVQHKVDPKETLYAISRKYNVAVSQIVEANPKVETTLRSGEIVLIPRRQGNTPAAGAKPAATSSGTGRTYTVSEQGNKIHVVEPKQTLYAIAKLYNVSVDDIKRWNNLQDNSIGAGTELIVGKGMAKPTKKPVYVPEPDDEMAKPKAAENTTTATAATTPVAAPVTPVAAAAGVTPVSTSGPAPAAASTPVRVADSEEEAERATATKRIVESGMAEMIDPKADTNKYLALHKTAPVGTIMQVKNAMNGQVVYVRVIGKLPETGANDKVVVRISKKAYQKLGAVDKKFRVEVSYMP